MRGSVMRLPSGTWAIMFDQPRVNGKRRQKQESVPGAKTKKDAEAALAKRLAEIAGGTYADTGSLTFNDLADRYLQARKRRVEDTSLALYRRTLDHHIRPTIGTVKLSALRSEHVEALLDGARDRSNRKTRKGKPLNATTLRYILIVIRAVLRWGVKMDKIARNVAAKVEPPKVPHREIEPFDAARVHGILAAAAGTEIEAVVTTAIGTGLRRGELCALRWSDLDLDAARISVTRSASLLNGEVIIKQPKTKQSRRNDALPAFVVEALRRHRAEQRKRHLLLGIGNRGTEGVVFDRADGTPWNPNELSRQFSRLVRRKKLPPTRFHDLRHGYATLALAAGVPLKIVSDSMGHARIGITADTYVHPADDQKHAKARMLDDFLNGAISPKRSA